MSTIDLTTIEQGLLSIFGTVLLAIASYAATQLVTWLKSKGIQVANTNFDAQAKAALGFGIAQSMTEIEAKGWNHIPTQNAIVALAANSIISKAPDTLAAVGITPTLGDPKTLELVQEALASRLPAAMLTASASPSTPDTPAQAAAKTAPVVVAVPVSAAA
jgi:hypothetical protein